MPDKIPQDGRRNRQTPQQLREEQRDAKRQARRKEEHEERIRRRRAGENESGGPVANATIPTHPQTGVDD